MKHEETSQAAEKGVYKSAEEFARAVELIEYNGLKRAVAVARAINEQRNSFFRPYIETSWESYSLESIEFDHYYDSLISDSHKEYYRQHWRSVNKSCSFHKSDRTNTHEWFNSVLEVSRVCNYSL